MNRNIRVGSFSHDAKDEAIRGPFEPIGEATLTRVIDE